DEYHKGLTPVRLRVLVHSEYHPFASRPNDSKFNQRIRWRISRAKADWYRWLRERPKETGVNLEIRDYWWDPSIRTLLLGRSEGFIGLYGMRFGPAVPLYRTEIPPAVD